MKIAYVVLKGIPHGGGIEKYTEEIGSRLADKGHEVIVYKMKHYGTKNSVHRGMIIKTVPSLKTRSLEKLTAAFMATLRQCFEQDVDIVHFHALGPSMFCFIPRILDRRTVVQGHGLEWKRSKWGFIGKTFLKLSEIPSVRFPHNVTSVSKVIKKYLIDKYGIESCHIPTGVNPPQIEKADLIKQYGLNGNDYIFFASRLVKEKGAHYLIRAYNWLKTDLKLVIAGNSENEKKYTSELHKIARDNKNIIFTGFVSGKVLDELFSNCYLFVLPSETEGLSTTLLEAMSYGNCCLVSDIAENLEALSNFGYYFTSKDVESLHEELIYLVNNKDAVELYKEQAKNHVLNNYTWDKISADYEELYFNIAKPKIQPVNAKNIEKSK